MSAQSRVERKIQGWVQKWTFGNVSFAPHVRR